MFMELYLFTVAIEGMLRTGKYYKGIFWPSITNSFKVSIVYIKLFCYCNIIRLNNGRDSAAFSQLQHPTRRSLILTGCLPPTGCKNSESPLMCLERASNEFSHYEPSQIHAWVA